MWVTTGLLFVACFFSWIVFLGHDGVTEKVQILRWIESGSLSTDWAIRLDRLTAIMLIVITTVSALVHLYSFGYMADDPQWKEGESYKPRFFAYLSFFTFAMLMLVTSDNLVQMFFGWEGVGVASYLLIGFYYRKPTANAAAIKAFVVNRVGDFGFALGIFALYYLTDSVKFDDIFAAVPALAETEVTFLWAEWNAANLIAVLLFIGAMGKSAQLFLHTWLPDAMEGPTPVSALIHAATMVTAGVFLVCRMSPLMEYAPEATAFIYIPRCNDCFCRCNHRSGSKRYQARDCLFNDVSARLYVCGRGRWCLLCRDVPPLHARLLQGDVVPWGRFRHPRVCTTNRTCVTTAVCVRKCPYILGDDDRYTCDHRCWYPSYCWHRLCWLLSKDAVIESAFAGGTDGGYAFWLLVIAALS